jgi:copper chaperone CopZ
MRVDPGLPAKEATVVTTHVFSVPDIACETCKNAVEGVLRALRGVRVAAVDVGTDTVSVEFEGITLAADELAAVSEQRGYRVEMVRDDAG